MRQQFKQERDGQGPRQTATREETGGSGGRGAISSLQAAVGNQRLQSALTNRSQRATEQSRDASDVTPQQSTLGVNEPNDRYEREADRIARRVTGPRDLAGNVTTRSKSLDRVQRLCSRCQRRLRAGKPLNCEECEAQLQRSVRTDGSEKTERTGTKETVDPATERQIQSLRGGGKALSDAVRSYFEPRFGHDFSDVRVHTGLRADEVSRSLGAEAFTLGSDVVFAGGNYRPKTSEGRQLLAHELTHVLQQTGGSARIQQQSDDTSQQAETERSARAGVELETRTDLWQRGGGSKVGTVYFSTDESTLDMEDRVELATLRQQLAGELGQRDGSYRLRFVGTADKRGTGQYNMALSIRRAETVERFFQPLTDFPNLRTETVAMGEFTTEQRGETAEELAAFRRVDIYLEPPMTTPIRKREPEPEPEPEKPECTPAKKGFPPSPSNCVAYAKNSWWLPSEYVHNATCACIQLPDSPTANCVRAHLQDRMAAVPQSTKNYWQRVVAFTESQERMRVPTPGGEIAQEAAEMLIHQKLTRMIYEHHVDAYQKCCCKSGPASYASWIGVVNVALPCSTVEQSIRTFGACGRGGW